MGHRELIESGKFDELLKNAARRIFRLEALPEYNVPGDRAMYDQFLRGVPLPPLESPEIREWDDAIKNHRKRGVSFERLRLMPEKVTPYLRYEIDWAYSYTASAGEETRFWPLSGTSQDIHLDFYVVDDSKLVHINYDPNGAWLGYSLETDLGYAKELITLSSKLWDKAASLEDFLASYRNRSV